MLERALSKRWLVFLVTGIVHGISTRGRALSSPDTAHYVKLADGFLSGNFSETFNLGAVRWTKTLYLSLLALARVTSPEHWKHIMVALNVVCSGVLAVLLVEVARRATRSVAAASVALLLYLGCFEVFQWIPFVLTDLLFATTAFIPLVLMARRILIPNEPPRTGLLLGSLLLTVFSRPPGVVLIPLALFVEFVLVRRRVSRGVGAVVIALVVLGSLVVRTAAVADPGRWPVAFIKPKIIEFSKREKTGEVVYARKETFRPPPRNATDHVVIVVDRFVRFFQFTSTAYSHGHNLINVAYFVPLYALMLVGVLHSLSGADPRMRALAIALLLGIGLFAYLYALTTLDYDWRSRVPAMPSFILLAACGTDAIVTWWRRKDDLALKAG